MNNDILGLYLNNLLQRLELPERLPRADETIKLYTTSLDEELYQGATHDFVQLLDVLLAARPIAARDLEEYRFYQAAESSRAHLLKALEAIEQTNQAVCDFAKGIEPLLKIISSLVWKGSNFEKRAELASVSFKHPRDGNVNVSNLLGVHCPWALPAAPKPIQENQNQYLSAGLLPEPSIQNPAKWGKMLWNLREIRNELGHQGSAPTAAFLPILENLLAGIATVMLDPECAPALTQALKAQGRKPFLIRQYLTQLQRRHQAHFPEFLKLYLDTPEYIQRELLACAKEEDDEGASGFSLHPIELPSTTHRACILGNGGEGKTWLLHALLHDIAEASQSPDAEERFLPVYIPLRNYQPPEYDLLGLIARELDLSEREVALQGLPWKWVFLFDGVNEIHPQHQQRFWLDLDGLESRFGDPSIVLTSRTALSQKGWDYFELAPINDHQLRDLMVSFSESAQRRDKGFDLVQYIQNTQNNYFLRDNRNNILMLTLAAAHMLKKDEQNLHSDGQLLQSLLGDYFSRENRLKALQGNTVTLQEMFSNIAVRMFEKGALTISRDEIDALINDQLRFAIFDDGPLLKLLQTGILQAEGNDYLFWHQKLADFYAAYHFVNSENTVEQKVEHLWHILMQDLNEPTLCFRDFSFIALPLVGGAAYFERCSVVLNLWGESLSPLGQIDLASCLFTQAQLILEAPSRLDEFEDNSSFEANEYRLRMSWCLEIAKAAFHFLALARKGKNEGYDKFVVDFFQSIHDDWFQDYGFIQRIAISLGHFPSERLAEAFFERIWPSLDMATDEGLLELLESHYLVYWWMKISPSLFIRKMLSSSAGVDIPALLEQSLLQEIKNTQKGFAPSKRRTHTGFFNLLGDLSHALILLPDYWPMWFDVLENTGKPAMWTMVLEAARTYEPFYRFQSNLKSKFNPPYGDCKLLPELLRRIQKYVHQSGKGSSHKRWYDYYALLADLRAKWSSGSSELFPFEQEVAQQLASFIQEEFSRCSAKNWPQLALALTSQVPHVNDYSGFQLRVPNWYKDVQSLFKMLSKGKTAQSKKAWLARLIGDRLWNFRCMRDPDLLAKHPDLPGALARGKLPKLLKQKRIQRLLDSTLLEGGVEFSPTDNLEAWASLAIPNEFFSQIGTLAEVDRALTETLLEFYLNRWVRLQGNPLEIALIRMISQADPDTSPEEIEEMIEDFLSRHDFSDERRKELRKNPLGSSLVFDRPVMLANPIKSLMYGQMSPEAKENLKNLFCLTQGRIKALLASVILAHERTLLLICALGYGRPIEEVEGYYANKDIYEYSFGIDFKDQFPDDIIYDLEDKCPQKGGVSAARRPGRRRSVAQIAGGGRTSIAGKAGRGGVKPGANAGRGDDRELNTQGIDMSFLFPGEPDFNWTQNLAGQGKGLPSLAAQAWLDSLSEDPDSYNRLTRPPSLCDDFMLQEILKHPLAFFDLRKGGPGMPPGVPFSWELENLNQLYRAK